jgi:hypothetical protein
VAEDDSDDSVGNVLHDWQMSMEEDQELQLPDMMTDDEIERLGILVSEVSQVPPPLPPYTTDIIPSSLTEDEALEQAMQN